MPTITITPTACSSAAGWTVLYNYLTTNSSYYPRQLLFTYPTNDTLGGAGANITKVTIHGYVRNSNSAVKRLRLGFRPDANSGVSDWAMLGSEAVLDQTFQAIAGWAASGYGYAQITREFAGNSLIARWLKQQFAAGEPVYLGVVQPDKGKSISVDTTLTSWAIDVDYELLGNIPTTDKSTMALNESVTTTINRVIADSTTTLTYRIGETVLNTVELGTGTTNTYTVPISAGSNFPNDLSTVLTIEATTAKGSETYGAIATNVTLTVPSNSKPVLQGGAQRVWNASTPASAKLNAYVQGQTGVNLYANIGARFGAAPVKATFKIEGVEYEKTLTTNGPMTVTGPSAISGSGTIPYTATVTDTRGLTTAVNGTITVLPWTAPQIQAFSVSRATEDGVQAIDGTCAYISLQASVSSLIVSKVEKNSMSFAIQYKKLGTTDDWTTCDTVTGSSISGTFTGLLQKDGAIIDTFDDMSGYAFQAVVTDIYASSTAADEMPTKEQFWDVDETTGKMGFGGDAPTDAENAGYRFYKFVDLTGGYKVYSEDEVATGNTWIDGKPIYRTCIQTTSSLSNAIGTVATLPSAVETPIQFSAFATHPSDGGWRPIPTAYHGNLSWSVLVYIAGDQIAMGFGSSWAGEKNVVITIEYTKG